MKRLRDLLSGIEFQCQEGTQLSVFVDRVVCDSRKVQPGDLFVAVSGPLADGHMFVGEAVSRGACGVVTERGKRFFFDSAIPHIEVESPSLTLGRILSNLYDGRVDRIRLVGVTGTNGKTTTAFLISYLLNHFSPCGLIGTVEYVWGGKRRRALNTTPGAAVFIPLLNEMEADGCSFCVSEVSSHALDQERLGGVRFESAVFTNLTQDHMDYHQTFDRYYLAKRKLFFNSPRPLHSVINIDDSYGRRLLEEVGEAAVSYGITREAAYRARNIEVTLEGCQFELCFPKGCQKVHSALPLYHNIYNILAALSVLSEMGFSIEKMAQLIASFPGVPGRMEKVSVGQPFHVFVDYAHTPDAFEHVLSEVRRLSPGKVITVFGCGGNRDRAKRPMMGRLASQFSDLVILTNDNPRNEEPASIIDEIAVGGASDHASILRIEDRREAIHKAIGSAKPKDVVLILGKGHETEQIVGEKIFSFSDVEIVRECLKDL